MVLLPEARVDGTIQWHSYWKRAMVTLLPNCVQMALQFEARADSTPTKLRADGALF